MAALTAGITGAAVAQGDPAVARSPKLKTKTFRSSTHGFSLEYPTDWRLVGGGVVALVSFDQKRGEASVVIEYELRDLETSPEDVSDTYVALEKLILESSAVKPLSVSARVDSVGSLRAVVLEFTRTGADGREERVREYILPVKRSVFRIICRAAPPFFDRHSATFAHIAASFAPATPAS